MKIFWNICNFQLFDEMVVPSKSLWAGSHSGAIFLLCCVRTIKCLLKLWFVSFPCCVIKVASWLRKQNKDNSFSLNFMFIYMPSMCHFSLLCCFNLNMPMLEILSQIAVDLFAWVMITESWHITSRFPDKNLVHMYALCVYLYYCRSQWPKWVNFFEKLGPCKYAHIRSW